MNRDRPHSSCDEHLMVSKVREAVREAGYTCLTRLDCEAIGSTIVLSGKVSTFHLRQVAQVTASNVQGVKKVIDKIVVTV